MLRGDTWRNVDVLFVRTVAGWDSSCCEDFGDLEVEATGGLKGRVDSEVKSSPLGDESVGPSDEGADEMDWS